MRATRVFCKCRPRHALFLPYTMYLPLQPLQSLYPQQRYTTGREHSLSIIYIHVSFFQPVLMVTMYPSISGLINHFYLLKSKLGHEMTMPKAIRNNKQSLAQFNNKTHQTYIWWLHNRDNSKIGRPPKVVGSTAFPMELNTQFFFGPHKLNKISLPN